MKTTARMLTGVSLIVPRTQAVNLIQSRIGSNMGFACSLMEKYGFSDSQFPPASFVMRKTREGWGRQEEKIQIVRLLLQILRSGDFVANTVFQNLILSSLQAEIHFYFNRLGCGAGSRRKYLKEIYRQVLEVARSREREQSVRGGEKIKGLFLERESGYDLYGAKTEIRKGGIRSGIEKMWETAEKGEPGYREKAKHDGLPEGAVIEGGKREGADAEGRRSESPGVKMPSEKSSEPGSLDAEEQRLESPGVKMPDEKSSEPGSLDAEEQRSGSPGVKMPDEKSSEPGSLDAEERWLENPRAEMPGEKSSESGSLDAEDRRLESPRAKMLVEKEWEPESLDTEERKLESPREKWPDEKSSEPGSLDAEERKAERSDARRRREKSSESERPEAKGTRAGKKTWEKPDGEDMMSEPSRTAMETWEESDKERLSADWKRELSGHREPAAEDADRSRKKEDSEKGQKRTSYWAEKKRGLERRLLRLQREFNGQAHMPSAEAARIYAYLETLTKRQQQAMAKVLGYDRTVLLEKLKGADNQTWRQMEEYIENRLALVRQQGGKEADLAWEEYEGKIRDSYPWGKDMETGSNEIPKNSQEMKDTEERPGLMQWRYRFSEWLGYLDNQDWDILSSAVRESRDPGLDDARTAFAGGQKQAVMEYFGRIKNMEELVPVLRLIHQKEPLKRMAAGWLPKESRLLRQAELLETARQLFEFPGSKEKKLLWDKWFSMLDEEDWKFFSRRIRAEKRIGYLELLPEEKLESMAHALGLDGAGMLRKIRQERLAENDRTEDFLAACIEKAETAFRLRKPEQHKDWQMSETEQKEQSRVLKVSVPAQEDQDRVSKMSEPEQEGQDRALEMSEPEKWKACLREWLEYMEMKDWEDTVHIILESEALVLKDAKTAFQSGQKAEVLGFLEQADWEELLPMVSLVYQNEGLARLAKGWLPEKKVFSMIKKGIDDKKVRIKIQEQKRQAFSEWRMLLQTASDDFPWEWTKEQYVKGLEQISAREAEAILLPVAALFYPYEESRRKNISAAHEGRGWKGSEREEDPDSPSLSQALRDDVRMGKMRQRILEAEQERWMEIRDVTALQVYRTVLKKQAEKPRMRETLIQAARSVLEKKRDYYTDMGFAYFLPEKGKERVSGETLWASLSKKIEDQNGYSLTEDAETIFRQAASETVSGRLGQAARQWVRLLNPDQWKTAKKPMLWNQSRSQEKQIEEFSYTPAQIVPVRPLGGSGRERQLTPSAPYMESMVKQVRQGTVNDIQFVNHCHEEARAKKKNEQQLDEVLKKISGQQKELEQMKQIQARLIRSTEPERMAETVMKQFKGQLKIEKLRKGR